MVRNYLWIIQLSRVTVEQLEQHLDSQPVFVIMTSQLQRCQLCVGNLDSHRMRYRLYQCRSAACASAPEGAVVCTTWIKTLSCLSSQLSAVYHHGAYAEVDQTTLNRMTLQMRRHTRQLAANGARPLAILSDMVDQLNLTEQTVLTLGQVQRVATYHRRVLLLAHALVGQMRETVRVLWYRDDLDETTPFTFACPIDDFGIPVIGNGSANTLFLIGVTTKRQIRRLYRAAAFLLRCYFQDQPVWVPDGCCRDFRCQRSIHVAAVFLTSHLRQEQYALIFSSLFDVYQLVTGSRLQVRYVMGDADDAQYNGFQQVVVSNCPGATYLMCFFHVMLNVKKRAMQLSESDWRLVFKHVYRIHHARDQFDADDEVTSAATA